MTYYQKNTQDGNLTVNIIMPMKIKVSIWEKTKGKCWYCGEKIGELGNTDNRRKYVVDHVVPKKKGGSDSINNLVPCCLSCNSTKGDSNIEYLRLVLALRKLESPPFSVRQIFWLLDRIELPYYKFYGEKEEGKKFLNLEQYKEILPQKTRAQR